MKIYKYRKIRFIVYEKNIFKKKLNSNHFDFLTCLFISMDNLKGQFKRKILTNLNSK